MDVTPIPKLAKKPKKHRAWPSPKDMGREVCEIKMASDCTFRATESHHRILRSRGGSDDPSNLVTACQTCHSWAHHNVAEATAAGFIKHGWEA